MRVLIVFVAFLFVEILSAQEPISIHLTEKEGLPDKQFYNLLEDDNGFIWLAADKGLYRYDGFEFKFYSHPEQVGLSVFSLTKDKDNIIWFTNLAGQLFYIQDDQVVLLQNLKDYFKGRLPKIQIHNDYLYLSQVGMLLVLNKNNGEIIYKKIDDSTLFYSTFLFKEKKVYSFDIDGDLYILDSTFQLSKTGNKVPINKRRHRRAYFKGVNNFLFLNSFNINGTSNKIILNADVENNFDYKLFETEEGFFTQEIRVIENELYILSNIGLYVYEIRNSGLVLKRKMLEGISTTDVLKDVHGNLWITTEYQGIHVIPNFDFKSNTKFSEIKRIKYVYQGKANELLLIGKKDEFSVFNTQTNSLKNYTYPNFEDIKYIFYNEAKDYYYIQGSRSIQTFNFKNDEIKILSIHNNLNTKDHHFHNKDTLLIATGANSMLINVNNITRNWIKAKNLTFNRSYSCYSNQKTKNYYVSTVKGLFVFNNNLTATSEIMYKGQSIYIRDIVGLEDGSVWCLSFKNGIYKVVNNKIEKNYTVKDGLLSNINGFLRVDSTDNSIWIAGEKGIQRLDTKTNLFKNITKKNGIPSYEFVGLEIIEGRLFAATPEELFSFDTKTVFQKEKHSKPNPYFNLVLIDNSKKPIKSSYQLAEEGKKIEIGFNTNGFLSNENVSYEYRLVNNTKESNWQKETSKTNKVIYNQLSQGNYVFQLRAKKDDEYSEVKEIAFKVNGVFYKQWWFFLLLTILTGFLIWSYFNRKNNQLKEKQKLIVDKQSKELENIFLKLESLRSQMNPHFIFNALNSIQDYILHNEKKLARTYLVKFSRLIRLYLEHSQKDTVSLSEELGALNFYLELEKDRFQDSFSYEINVDENIDKDLIEIPTFLIQPYVENAIKHGLLHKKENRKLEIHFSINKESNVLHCSIDDNGVGRSTSTEINQRKAFKHVSFSSEANAKRIDLLNRTRKRPIHLEIKDKYNAALEPTGTMVKIDIPLEM